MMDKLLRAIQGLEKRRRAIFKYIFHIEISRVLKQISRQMDPFVPFSVLLALVCNSRSTKVIEKFLRYYRPDLLADLGMVAYLVELYLKVKKKMSRGLRSAFIRLFREMHRLFIELDVAVCRMVYPSWILVANYVKADMILRSTSFGEKEIVLRNLLEYVRDLFGGYIRCLFVEGVFSLRLDPFFVFFAVKIISKNDIEKLKRIFGARTLNAIIDDYYRQALELLSADVLDARMVNALKILYEELCA